MAEVTNELIYELLTSLQRDVAELKQGQAETHASVNALRGYLGAVQQDISNIYAILARHDGRLDRIERQLGITEPEPE